MKRTLMGLLLVVSLASILAAACSPSKAEIAAQQRDQCFANEQQIKMAIDLVNADTGVYPEIGGVVTKLGVKCPAGGTYSFDPNTNTVSCSVHGHK